MDRIKNDKLMFLADKEEPRFLSILLRDKDCLMEAIAYGIKPGDNGHFWNLKCRRLYEIIFSYFKKYNAILTRTAIDSVIERKLEAGSTIVDDADRAAMRMYWDKIYNLNVTCEDYNYLVNQINNRFVQWQAYNILQERMQKLTDSIDSQDKIVKDIREDFYKIDGLDADPYVLTMGMNEGIDKAMEYVVERRDKPDEITTILTGLHALDDIFFGFDRGSYTIISGMVNGGKTTLMFNIAFNMARAGYNVVYVSLEKKAIPMFTRLLALHALVDFNRIRRGGTGSNGVDEYTYTRLEMAANELKNKIKPNLDVIQMAQGTKVSKIISRVDRVLSNKKVDVLVVDYLGAIGHESKHSTRPDLDEAETSQRIQSYGRIKNLLTITASQLKTPSSKDIRGKAKKSGGDDANNVEVSTEDLSGSKMIGADADNILGCVLNADHPPTKMYVHITKARDAESRKTVVLDFDGKLGRISDPILEPGQITEVDQLIYNTNITEEKLASDDDLFSDNKNVTKNTVNTKDAIEKINNIGKDIKVEAVEKIEFIDPLDKKLDVTSKNEDTMGIFDEDEENSESSESSNGIEELEKEDQKEGDIFDEYFE